MTELRMRRLLDEMDDKLVELRSEYERRFEDLPVNRFGEVIASAVLDLNAWHIREENRIKGEFIKAVTNA